MREQLRADPVQWLKGAPLPVASPDHDVLTGFDRAKPMTVVRFKGPHTFYRMAGYVEKTGKMADPYGCWWIDETALNAIQAKVNRFDMFEGWVPPEHLARMKSLPMHYRALAAICRDWNDFREQVMLSLPAGEELQGLVGAVAPQPVRSTMDPKSRKTPMLQGGIEQVYFKKGTSKAANINPLWVHWTKIV